VARLRLLRRGAQRCRPHARLERDDIELARQGTATDPKTAPIVAFGQQIVAAPAEITDDTVEALRKHGYRDEQIADVVGLVALNVLTGAFNLVVGIDAAAESRSAA
jgi:alkylhydroperoxidase family enzyme